jgi:RNA polymerase sigma factor (sigma-70 family)
MTSDEAWLADRFEECRPHLHAVAYRMLGSLTEADDAVQESWLRLSRSDACAVDDLRGWLITVTGRICLDMLRARRTRREALAGSWLPEPVVEREPPAGEDPEQEAVLADSVGLALLVVLETLGPAERLAFVLHDVFGVPFDEIGEMTDRSTEAARQLAARARRRIRAAPAPDTDVRRQREVVDAFFAAARTGDMQRLLDVLDPRVVFRIDVGPEGPFARPPVTGAAAVAGRVLELAPRFAHLATPVLVNGQAGAMAVYRGQPIGVIGFTIVAGRIVGIDLMADPDKLARLRPPSARS